MEQKRQRINQIRIMMNEMQRPASQTSSIQSQQIMRPSTSKHTFNKLDIDTFSDSNFPQTKRAITPSNEKFEFTTGESLKGSFNFTNPPVDTEIQSLQDEINQLEKEIKIQIQQQEDELNQAKNQKYNLCQQKQQQFQVYENQINETIQQQEKLKAKKSKLEQSIQARQFETQSQEISTKDQLEQQRQLEEQVYFTELEFQKQKQSLKEYYASNEQTKAKIQQCKLNLSEQEKQIDILNSKRKELQVLKQRLEGINSFESIETSLQQKVSPSQNLNYSPDKRRMPKKLKQLDQQIFQIQLQINKVLESVIDGSILDHSEIIVLLDEYTYSKKSILQIIQQEIFQQISDFEDQIFQLEGQRVQIRKEIVSAFINDPNSVFLQCLQEKQNLYKNIQKSLQEIYSGTQQHQSQLNQKEDQQNKLINLVLCFNDIIKDVEILQIQKIEQKKLQDQHLFLQKINESSFRIGQLENELKRDFEKLKEDKKMLSQYNKKEQEQIQLLQAQVQESQQNLSSLQGKLELTKQMHQKMMYENISNTEKELSQMKQEIKKINKLVSEKEQMCKLLRDESQQVCDQYDQQINHQDLRISQLEKQIEISKQEKEEMEQKKVKLKNFRMQITVSSPPDKKKQMNFMKGSQSFTSQMPEQIKIPHSNLIFTKAENDRPSRIKQFQRSQKLQEIQTLLAQEQFQTQEIPNSLVQQNIMQLENQLASFKQMYDSNQRYNMSRSGPFSTQISQQFSYEKSPKKSFPSMQYGNNDLNDFLRQSDPRMQQEFIKQNQSMQNPNFAQFDMQNPQMSGNMQQSQQVSKLEESMGKLQDQLNQLTQQLQKNPQQESQQEKENQLQIEESKIKEQKAAEEAKQAEITNLNQKIKDLEEALAKKELEKQQPPPQIEEQKAQEIPQTEVIQQNEIKQPIVEEQKAPEQSKVDRSALRLQLQQILEEREIKVNIDELVTKAKIKNPKKLKPEELSFFQDISPLLLGIKCFKKSAKAQPFDPLLGHLKSPVEAGFEQRKFQLQKLLNKIDPLFVEKKGGDPAIPIENIKSIQLAPQSQQLIQLQAQLKETLFNNQFDPVELEAATSQYQAGSADQSSEEYSTLVLHCKYYEVHLISVKGPKIEMLTDNVVYAQQLISGIEALIKQKKNIAKLKANVG